MIYKNISPFIHLFVENANRKYVEMEVMLTSGGSWFEEPTDSGKRHLLEHCIVARTKEMDFNQLKDYTFRENIYLNAYTSRLSMGFEGGSHFSDFGKLTDLIMEFTFDPNLQEEDLNREKEIVLREISERRGDPNYQLHFDAMRQIFEEGSLKLHETLGSSERVAETTLSDFKRLYQKALSESHVFIMVYGGGIDIDYLEQKINSYIQKKDYYYLPSLLSPSIKKPVDFEVPSTFKTFSSLPYIHPFGHSHVELSLFIPIEVSFDNLPVRKIFHSLFTSFDGELYDRLRNELGLIYSLQSQFDLNTQTLNLDISCEIRHLNTIVDETRAVFSNYDRFFKPIKFEEFKSIVKKKAEISLDTPSTTVNHARSMLQNYNRVQTYQEYIAKIDGVTEDEMHKLYNSITDGLNSMKIVGVSKDESLKEVLEMK